MLYDLLIQQQQQQGSAAYHPRSVPNKRESLMKLLPPVLHRRDLAYPPVPNKRNSAFPPVPNKRNSAFLPIPNKRNMAEELAEQGMGTRPRPGRRSVLNKILAERYLDGSNNADGERRISYGGLVRSGRKRNQFGLSSGREVNNAGEITTTETVNDNYMLKAALDYLNELMMSIEQEDQYR